MPLSMQSKPIVEDIKKDLVKRVNKLKDKRYNTIDLIIFVNSRDSASQVYLKNKINFGNDIGVSVELKGYENKKDIMDILNITYCPFIIQEPALISQKEIDEILNKYYLRDMDCFGSYSFGLMAHKNTSKFPCTPIGIIKLLEYYHIMDQFETVCILGRSKIVGSPLEILLRDYYNKTVFVCHSKTKIDIINNLMKESQVIVSAIGKHDAFWVPPDKVLIDVGINKNWENKIVGDFSNKDYLASRAYTPVPGGVGPMTVASLMENTISFYERVE